MEALGTITPGERPSEISRPADACRPGMGGRVLGIAWGAHSAAGASATRALELVVLSEKMVDPLEAFGVVGLLCIQIRRRATARGVGGRCERGEQTTGQGRVERLGGGFFFFGGGGGRVFSVIWGSGCGSLGRAAERWPEVHTSADLGGWARRR